MPKTLPASPTFARAAKATLAATSASALMLCMAPAALAEPTSDSNPLSQTVEGNEATSKQQVLFNSGHMDIGPRVVNGHWTLQIRDDSAKTPVWRDFANTVITVKDNAQLRVPENKKYSFIGEKPGTRVWVLPQTEKQNIPWPGWNTQHPTALKVMNGGANFTLDKITGPGNVMMYMENGALEGPQVLWDSHKKSRQNIFAEANTHTHANWIFTKPGVYFLQVTSSAKTKSGKLVKDTEVLRFAVGNDTDPGPGFEAAPAVAGGDHGDSSNSSWTDGPWLWIGAAALALVVGIGATVGSKRRKDAIAEGQADAHREGGSSEAQATA